MDPVLLAPPVRMTAAEACDVARATFGVSASQARNLGSERDQTFMLQDAAGAPVAVMKVSNPAEDPGTLDMEALGARHAAQVDPPCTSPCPGRSPARPGAGPQALRAATERDGITQWVRMYDVEPGTGRTGCGDAGRPGTGGLR